MSTILDGRIVRAELKKSLIERIKNLSKPPTLAIVQVADRPDSTAFIGAKRKFAAEIGAKEVHVKIAHTAEKAATQAEVIRTVMNLDADPSVDGIIVQLPLPLTLDKDVIIAAISPEKDVDGLTPTNVLKWTEGRADAMWPATARGIRELLSFYKIPLSGKKVTVIGRSSLVGKPIAAMCAAEDAIVTVCHRETKNLPDCTRDADVLIVAIGNPRYIGTSYVGKGTVVIDVGISPTENGLVGDVDFEAVKDIAAAITPVPGGVGQMTVLALFENLVDVC